MTERQKLTQKIYSKLFHLAILKQTRNPEFSNKPIHDGLAEIRRLFRELRALLPNRLRGYIQETGSPNKVPNTAQDTLASLSEIVGVNFNELRDFYHAVKNGNLDEIKTDYLDLDGLKTIIERAGFSQGDDKTFSDIFNQAMEHRFVKNADAINGGLLVVSTVLAAIAAYFFIDGSEAGVPFMPEFLQNVGLSEATSFGFNVLLNTWFLTESMTGFAQWLHEKITETGLGCPSVQSVLTHFVTLVSTMPFIVEDYDEEHSAWQAVIELIVMYGLHYSGANHFMSWLWSNFDEKKSLEERSANKVKQATKDRVNAGINAFLANPNAFLLEIRHRIKALLLLKTPESRAELEFIFSSLAPSTRPLFYNNTTGEKWVLRPLWWLLTLTALAGYAVDSDDITKTILAQLSGRTLGSESGSAEFGVGIDIGAGIVTSIGASAFLSVYLGVGAKIMGQICDGTIGKFADHVKNAWNEPSWDSFFSYLFDCAPEHCYVPFYTAGQSLYDWWQTDGATKTGKFLNLITPPLWLGLAIFTAPIALMLNDENLPEWMSAAFLPFAITFTAVVNSAVTNPVLSGLIGVFTNFARYLLSCCTNFRFEREELKDEIRQFQRAYNAAMEELKTEDVPDKILAIANESEEILQVFLGKLPSELYESDSDEEVFYDAELGDMSDAVFARAERYKQPTRVNSLKALSAKLRARPDGIINAGEATGLLGGYERPRPSRCGGWFSCFAR